MKAVDQDVLIELPVIRQNIPRSQGFYLGTYGPETSGFNL